MPFPDPGSTPGASTGSPIGGMIGRRVIDATPNHSELSME